MNNEDHKTTNTLADIKKGASHKENKSETKSQVSDKAELLKKHKYEPDSAKKNLDIPGARAARPLTNDRHPDE